MPGQNRRVEMPMQTRLAPIGTVDQKTRTAEVVWTTGARVKRYDWMRDQWYLEELSLDPAAVRMGRLQSGGAPVLNTHQRYTLADQIGVVENAALGSGQGTALLRFSARADVEPIFQDVLDRIFRNVSAGYVTHRQEILPPDDKSNGLPIYRAVDWEPMEISPVPMGADAGAGFRAESQQRTYPCEIIETVSLQTPAVNAINRKESTMDDKEKAAQAAAAEAARIEQEKQQQQRTAADKAASDIATAAERNRVKQIRDLCGAHKLERAFEDKLIDDNVALDQARAQVLAELAKKTTSAPVRSGGDGAIFTISDEATVRRSGMVTALLARYDPRSYDLSKKENEVGRQYAGMNLREMMRFCLEAHAVRTAGMSPVQMWERTVSLSSSDLPAIMLDAANKTLRQAYDSSPRTFVTWARESTAPDFKNINRIQLSGAPSLLQVASGGEIKRGAVTDGKEVYQLASFARIIGINRQVIINDDTGAFTRVPALCARAGADLESDTVYGIVTANAALGVDSVALFDATNHKNYTASGTVIAVASLAVGRAAVRKQKGLEGRPLNLRPIYLIVPAALEAVAEQYTSNAYQANVQTSINPFAQGGRAQLTPIAEARLDDNSATAWYLAADSAQVDTVEYAYLEGQQGVYLESRLGFEVDGIEIKVREDFAAKALDFRGLYKNAGA